MLFRNHRKIFLTFLVLKCYSESIFKRKELQVRLDKTLAPCPLSHILAIEYTNVSHIINKAGNFIINYNLVARENLPNKKIKVILSVTKCLKKESPDTCYHFFDFKSDKTCEIFKSKGQVWSKFLDCQRPKMFCPVKKGSYVGTDCIIDVSKFKLFPLGDFYWKINHSYWQENRLIMCGVTSGQVISRPVT